MKRSAKRAAAMPLMRAMVSMGVRFTAGLGEAMGVNAASGQAALRRRPTIGAGRAIA